MAKTPPTPPPEPTPEVAPEVTPEVTPEAVVAAPAPEPAPAPPPAPPEPPKAKSRKWWRGVATFSKSRHALADDQVPEGAVSGPGQLFCVCAEHEWMSRYPKHFAIYPPPVKKD